MLNKGTDGNTLLDECGQETPAGSELSFFMRDTVSADFSFRELKGCTADTFYFTHNGQQLVNQWQWTFPNQTRSTRQNPVYTTTFRGTSTFRLVVSNGFCQDTSEQVFVSEGRIHAAFTGPSELCPKDGVQFTDGSTGPITSWNWEFGNGSTSSQPNPSLQYYQQPARDIETIVRLIIKDQIGCTDSALKKLLLVSSCLIVVPNAFTPNNDGKNDLLFPSNAYKADNLVFRVFNRYGQLVFETRDWTRKWDGKLNGRELDSGTYVWTLQYKQRDSGRQYALKGTTLLIR
jgi:gliding motility-associated-like protein